MDEVFAVECAVLCERFVRSKVVDSSAAFVGITYRWPVLRSATMNTDGLSPLYEPRPRVHRPRDRNSCELWLDIQLGSQVDDGGVNVVEKACSCPDDAAQSKASPAGRHRYSSRVDSPTGRLTSGCVIGSSRVIFRLSGE